MTAELPTIDTNAALAAAVAAAAEIAKHGLDPCLLTAMTTQVTPNRQFSYPVVEAPNVSAATAAAITSSGTATTMSPATMTRGAISSSGSSFSTAVPLSSTALSTAAALAASTATATPRSLLSCALGATTSAVEQEQDQTCTTTTPTATATVTTGTPPAVTSSSNHAPLLAIATAMAGAMPSNNNSTTTCSGSSLVTPAPVHSSGRTAPVDATSDGNHSDTNSIAAHDEPIPENETEEDAELRLARSRERNREHARRTRLRKKQQLEALQARVRELEAEKKRLKLAMDECSIASILVGLSETVGPPADHATESPEALLEPGTMHMMKPSQLSFLTGSKRKRFVSPDADDADNKPIQALKLNIGGEVKVLGPKSHINWKSGIYTDEEGVQRQLTIKQLESLRRERNRMHAKMTRDRKKNFIATIEKVIEQLEKDNQKMRDVLQKVGIPIPATVKGTDTAAITPEASPVLKVAEHPSITTTATSPHESSVKPAEDVPKLMSASSCETTVATVSSSEEFPPLPPLKKVKVAHGFSLAV